MVKEIYNLNDENLIYLLKKSVESIYNIVKAKN